MPPHVLIIDDERNFRDFLGEALESHGYRVDTAATALAGLDRASSILPQVVLLDQNLPDRPGLEILPELRRVRSNPVVIVLTAHAEYSRAVTAMQAGAFHYLGKPFDFEQLLETLSRACVDIHPQGHDDLLPDLVGSSPEMLQLKRDVAQVARSPVASVLVQGESGTGKELVAQAIHHLSRAAHRLVSVNCGALTESLLMSELFGHEKGAFTDARERKRGVFEAANGGTLFLDEVSEMGPRAQAALLRVLEQRTITRVGGTDEIAVDMRIVAATNRPLEEMIEAGSFRPDLYYRLNVVQLQLPPLRQRGHDIVELAQHFNRSIARRYQVPPRNLSPEVRALLATYAWPGNVRELRNVLERAYVLGTSVEISELDLPAELRGRGDEVVRGEENPTGFQLAKRRVVEEFERDYLIQLLTRTFGNVSRAAREAGMLRQGFQKLLVRHNIDARRFRGFSE